VKITYFGHSCFKLSENGFELLIDPFGDVPGYENVHTLAHAVLCSHEHHDHNAVEGVKCYPYKAENPFGITMMQTYHDKNMGKDRGENLVHIITAEGKKAVHLGDLGHILNDKQIGYVKGCEVLMIPVGGTYTLDCTEAWELIHKINPKIVIPMHYRNGKYGYEVLQSIADFVKNADRRLVVLPQAEFELPEEENIILIPSVYEYKK